MKQAQEHEAWHGRAEVCESRLNDLRRIAVALQQASTLCKNYTREAVQMEQKAGGEPVTAVDRAINELLLEILLRGEEGWLSEESADDRQRLNKRRVWVVDPLDGTKEFLAGLPEWCISIGLVEDGQVVAGGICNPMTHEVFIGSRETGIRYVPREGGYHSFSPQEKPLVLASRSEMGRGEWNWAKGSPFNVHPVGSVAYKLGLVAAGLADATWTLVPKSEWDIAAGVALVLASGGTVRGLDGKPLLFNQPETVRNGLLAFARSAENRLARDFQDPLVAEVYRRFWQENWSVWQ